MKIHLDYLEGRVEELENINLKLTSDKKQHAKKIQLMEDKYKVIQESKEQDLELLTADLKRVKEKYECAEKKYRENIERLQGEVEQYKVEHLQQ